MDPERYGIEETDYDAGDGRRWFYRLFTDSDGRWYWEPRLPTEKEMMGSPPVDGFAWTPTLLKEADWPPLYKRGPYPDRREALVAAETWFDPPAGPARIP